MLAINGYSPENINGASVWHVGGDNEEGYLWADDLKNFKFVGISTMPFKLRSLRHFILLYGTGDYSLSGYRGEIIRKQPNRVIHMSFPQLMFKNCKIPRAFQLEV